MTPSTARDRAARTPRPGRRTARHDARGPGGDGAAWRPHTPGPAERRGPGPLPDRPDRAGAGAPRDPAVGARRVLVVDDEPAIRLLCRVNLPLSGFDVVEAADGEDALARVRDGAFDLVLLDVMMPGLNGFVVAERLRADPATASTPIVFLSARADEEDIRRGLALGAADYVTKPFDPLALGAHLTEVLRALAPAPDGDRGGDGV